MLFKKTDGEIYNWSGTIQEVCSKLKIENKHSDSQWSPSAVKPSFFSVLFLIYPSLV